MTSKLLTALCVCTVSLTANCCTDFDFPVNFEDNKSERSLLLDVTTSESFVLDSDTYQKEFGPENTFNPDDSKTFKNLSEPFRYPLASKFNQHPSTVSGYIGQDAAKVFFRENVTSRFAVITDMSSRTVVKGCGGNPFAGRIGLSKARNGKTNLGLIFLATLHDKIVCMAAKRQFKLISIGFFNYRKEEFLSKVKALPSADGHWVAKIDQFKIADSQTFADLEATISTTLHGISLPSTLFNTVVRTLGGKYNRENETYIVDCNQSLVLGLEINKAKIAIPFEAYVRKINGVCTLLLKSHAESKQVVLGQAYFLNHGVCLDYKNDEIHFHDLPEGASIRKELTRINGGLTYVTKKHL